MSERIEGYQPPKGNIVAKYVYGNARITVMDDAAAKTEEEKKKVLDGLYRRIVETWPYYDHPEDFVDKPIEFEHPLISLGPDGDFDAYFAERDRIAAEQAETKKRKKTRVK